MPDADLTRPSGQSFPLPARVPPGPSLASRLPTAEGAAPWRPDNRSRTTGRRTTGRRANGRGNGRGNGRRARRRHSAAVYRARQIGVLGLVGALVAVLVIALSGSKAVPGPPPRPAVPPLVATLSAARNITVPGTLPTIPWPAGLQAAVGVPAAGFSEASPVPESPTPVASVTKIMTAYVILQDHPLAVDQQGPSLKMTMQDELDYANDVGINGSNVPVQAGEWLTEREMLQGLMVHSADNLADTLAKWDAGSVSAFVAKMNATAHSLGMLHTRYADASGLSPQSESTAADTLVVAEHAMQSPAFRAIDDESSVVLPFAGRVYTFTPSIGLDGIVGVKSGFTQAALGCLAQAAIRDIDGRPVVLYAVVLNQPGYNPLGVDSTEDQAMIDALAAGLRVEQVAATGTAVGQVSVAGLSATSATGGQGAGGRGHGHAHDRGHATPAPDTVAVVTSAALGLVVWPGEQLTITSRAARLPQSLDAGSVVGTLLVDPSSPAQGVPGVVGLDPPQVSLIAQGSLRS